MNGNAQPFVTAAPNILAEVGLTAEHSDDWRLICEALEQRFSVNRSWLVSLLYPMTEKYSQLTLHSISEIERGGFELWLNKVGHHGYDSDLWVRVFPARRFGLFGRRTFVVYDVTG